MITPKNVLVATSITIVGAMFYLGGTLKGWMEADLAS